MTKKLKMKERDRAWAGCSFHQWRHISCSLCRNLIGDYKLFRSDKEMVDLMTKRHKNEYHAYKMLKIFFKGYNMDIGVVSEAVMLALKDKFGEVLEEDRANVYVMFVNMLHKRNIKFNVKQFQI